MRQLRFSIEYLFGDIEFYNDLVSINEATAWLLVFLLNKSEEEVKEIEECISKIISELSNMCKESKEYEIIVDKTIACLRNAETIIENFK